MSVQLKPFFDPCFARKRFLTLRSGLLFLARDFSPCLPRPAMEVRPARFALNTDVLTLLRLQVELLLMLIQLGSRANLDCLSTDQHQTLNEEACSKASSADFVSEGWLSER